VITLWRNARIATCDGQDREYSPGALVTEAGTIRWIGPERELPAGIGHSRVVELAGRWITPGLVDCHTHLVFGGQRAAEFARRCSGSSYGEIAREGGGILGTMRATRAAGEAALLEQGAPRLRSLQQEGVTTVEIKSGYGLDLESEARMLRVARALGKANGVTVVTSLLAAHALPPEFAGRPDEYIDEIVQRWLPALAREGLVDAVDAYCETIAFSAAQCDRLFTAAASLGLPVRLHAEQLSNVGGSRLAARHRALSCDHLEYATDEDVAPLAHAGTVAVLLPVAFYILAEKQLPPVDALRNHGVPIAIASDCNPGTGPGASLLIAANMARRLFGLTSAEVLRGMTCHAARALGVDRRRGILQPGMAADFAVWAIDSPDELGYWIGFNPCSMVVRNGEIALERAV
jgi:imidazolonepropionase